MQSKIQLVWRDQILAAILLLISVLAVNGWSYWGDELSTVLLASKENFIDLTSCLSSWKGSESQMPLFIVVMWIWQKIFGGSEFAMRSFNILQITILLAYVFFVAVPRINNKEKKVIKVSLVFTIVSPFIIYNMNEARVNISLLVFAYICYLGIYIGLKYKNNQNLFIALIALCLGFAFNMLFAFIVPTIIILALYLDKEVLKEHWLSIVITLLVCLIIGCYYLWTFTNGKGGAVENPGIKNIAFSLYQFLGFEGMGPEKNTLRISENLISTVKPFFITLCLMSIGYILLFIQICRYKISNKILALFLVSFVIFFICAYIVHFRFWGRHIIMFYPLWSIALAIYAIRLWNYNTLAKASVVLFSFLMLVSTLRIEMLDCYKKENIRGEIGYVNAINKSNKDVYYVGVDYPINNYIVHNEKSLSSFNASSQGYMLYMKNMAIFNKAQYNVANPYYLPSNFRYRILRNDKDAIIYYFQPINK